MSSFYRPSRSHPLRGFTLLELVLVMVVLAVMLAIAVPSVRGFLGTSRSRDAVDQIIAVSQWARAQAAAESKVYRLAFAADSYQLTVQEGESFTNVRSDFGRPFVLPQGTRVELVPSGVGNTKLEAGSIAFHPNGRADAVVVRLTDADGRVTLIGCLSPVEPFHVVTAEEAANL